MVRDALVLKAGLRYDPKPRKGKKSQRSTGTENADGSASISAATTARAPFVDKLVKPAAKKCKVAKPQVILLNCHPFAYGQISTAASRMHAHL